MPQYPNRSDLRDRPTYGEKQKIKDSTSVVPVAPSPVAAPMQLQGPRPGSFAPLTAPTQRPNEPITAGAAFGPGDTPLQAGIPIVGQQQNAMSEIKAIFQLHPNDDLLNLLDKYGDQ